MRCWHCHTELIWGGDHDVEDEDVYFPKEPKGTAIKSHLRDYDS